MAELHSDPNVINPILEVDQQQVDKDYDQEKPEMLAATAVDEINATTGLSDIFNDQLLPSGIARTEWGRRGEVNRLQESFSNRIRTVLTNSSVNYENSLDSGNQATSGMLERTVWHHRRANVIDSIMNNRAGAEQSVNVAAGCLKFMETVEVKIKDELQTEQEKYKQDFERYNNLWSIVGFGRKSREDRFNKLSAEVSTSVSSRLNELRDRAKKIESTADGAVKRTGANLTRRLKMAPSTQKVAMWQQLQGAVSFNRTMGLASLDLSEFGIIDDQAKINALEALARDPWLKDQVAALGESTARHQHQESLVNTARDQETVINTPPRYTGMNSFTDLEAAPAFNGLPAFEGAVNTEDLVNSLWRELYNTSGGTGNYPENLFTSYNISHALLTPSVKLHILLNELHGGGAPWANAQNKITDVMVRQKLLKFMTEKNKATIGSIEEHDDAETQDSINDLQNQAIPSLSRMLQNAQQLDFSKTIGDFDTIVNDLDRTNATSRVSVIRDLYNQFLQREPDMDSSDFVELGKSWTKTLAALQFLDTNASNWRREKNEFEGHEKDHLDSLTKRRDKLVQEEKKLQQKLKTTTTAANRISKSERDNCRKRLNELGTLIPEAESNLATINSSRNGKVLSQLSGLQTHLDFVDVDTTRNWLTIVKPATTAHLSSFSERLYESIKDDFAKEAETQFLNQWAKNDQFEMLKTRKSGLVNISFREVGALTRLTFPQELNGAENDVEFRIERSDSSGICLVETGAARRRIRIVGPAVQAGSPPRVTKNAALFSAATPGAVGGAATGNHPTEAIVTNIKLAA